MYAAGCTFVQNLKLANCRNTTQGGCTKSESRPFSYQPLDVPPGFTWITNVGNNVCCDQNTQTKLRVPKGLVCNATVAIYPKSGDCTAGVNATSSMTYGPSTGGSATVGGTITIPLTCLGLTSSQVVSSSRYDVVVTCNSIGAPPECIN